jgi:ribulose-bisphosphate carboxylase large chain
VSNDDATRIRATYEVRADPAEIDAVARALATEQSVEMPVTAITDQRVLDEVVGRVDEIVATGPDRFLVTLGLAAETVGATTSAADTAQLLNMLFGNCSLLDEVRLVDVELPEPLLAAFDGPRHGIAGLRRLCGAEGRPLSCTALKPQGLPAEALAALCERFARAGLDVIKDDHGIADQAAAPFARRVEACQAAVARANAATGRTVRYAPSLVGPPSVLARNAAVARDLGVQIVLVAPSLIGPPAFRELLDEHLGGMAVLAHPAFAGAARVDPPLLLGAIYRLLGADATIFPNVGGRFSYSAERCAAIAERARRPWGHLAGCMPVPAGGMTTDRVPELRAAYGDDTMLLIGGALLAAGDGLDREAARFVAAVARTGE